MSRTSTFGARRRRAAATGMFGALALLAYVALTAVPAAAVGGTYVVNSTDDRSDLQSIPGGVPDQICRTNQNVCTLRAALFESEQDGGPSTINFNITGAGPHTIASYTNLRGALPALTEGGTTINGYSQTGATPNTNQFVSNAVIKIELAGVNGNPQALLITSDANAVRGLAIYGADRDIRIGNTTDPGGVVQSGNDNVIAGNFLGTNAAGTFGATTRDNANDFGVIIRSASKRNTIGGPAVADRNVLSGHQGRAILIGVPGTTEIDTGVQDNVVENNIMGLTPDGTAARPNYGHAIDINNGASGNRVEGNVVSGQIGVAEGIEVSHSPSTHDNQIIDNKIGTDPTGTSGPAYAANGGNGIRIEDGADATVVRGNIIGNNGDEGIAIGSLANPATSTVVEDNFIGVTPGGVAIPNAGFGIRITPGEGTPNPAAATDTLITGNTIANNPTGIGIEGSGSVRNRITDNSIHDNTGLGIDLAPFGQANQNDVGDGDSGPNTLLNWPELTGATTLTVSGTACGGCAVEVYDADSSATLPGNLQTSYGEGQTRIATTTANPDGSFVAALPPSTNGHIVTATATDATGNTSEFSRNIAVPGSNAPPVPAFIATCPGLDCSFNAGPTTDPDGDAITSYSWNFGDSGTATGATPSHTYGAPGTYRVTLTVQDARGANGSNTSSLFVSGDTRKARDGFSRTVASGWGNAETGGAWTGTSGNTGLSVSGGAGVASVPVNSNREVDLNGVSTQQTDASVTVTVNRVAVGGDHLAAIVARRQSATLAYRGRVPHRVRRLRLRRCRGRWHPAARAARPRAHRPGRHGHPPAGPGDRRQPDHHRGQGVAGRPGRAGLVPAHHHRLDGRAPAGRCGRGPGGVDRDRRRQPAGAVRRPRRGRPQVEDLQDGRRREHLVRHQAHVVEVGEVEHLEVDGVGPHLAE